MDSQMFFLLINIYLKATVWIFIIIQFTALIFYISAANPANPSTSYKGCILNVVAMNIYFLSYLLQHEANKQKMFYINPFFVTFQSQLELPLHSWSGLKGNERSIKL